MRISRTILSAVLFVAAPLSLRADTLASFTGMGLTTQTPNYLGEKFTTSGSGTYSSIAFDFLTAPAETPYALGTAFLLTQQYLGAPGSLSSATAGYLGSAAASGSGSFYNFGSGVTLQSGTVYYLYENALVPSFTIAAAAGAPSSDEFYYAASGGSFIGVSGDSAAFTVNGNPVTQTSPVPEPSSLALLATGLLGAAGLVRRRF